MRKTKMSDKGSKAWTAGIIVVCFALAINPDVIDCDYYRFEELDSGVFV